MKVAIISPVRNEEKNIRVTIESVLTQTLHPINWVIVDDGSSDNTGNIIQYYLKNVPFMQYLRLDDRGYRKPGQGVVEGFYRGFKKIENTDYDIVAKMDGDLHFQRDTIETICKAFADDSTLGIAGATRYEKIGMQDTFTKMPVAKGWVGGPFKFYRRKCFEDIGGLLPRAGWDGVDIVMAAMKGWRTGEIESLKIYHLKPTGTAQGEGLIQACEKYGDISYFMGGFFWYFILRALGRSLLNRNPRIGLYMVRGYLKSKQNRVAREPHDFRVALRKMQIDNTVLWFNRLLKVIEPK